MGPYKAASHITYIQIADAGLNIHHSIVRNAYGEIYTSDLVAALIVANAIYNDSSPNDLRDDDCCRSFERCRDVDLSPVPSLNGHCPHPVHQLQTDILA